MTFIQNFFQLPTILLRVPELMTRIPPKVIGACRILNSSFHIPYSLFQQGVVTKKLIKNENRLENVAQVANTLVNLGSLVISTSCLIEGIAYMGFWNLHSVVKLSMRFTAVGIAMVGLFSITSNIIATYKDTKALNESKGVDSNLLMRYLYFSQKEAEQIAETARKSPEKQDYFNRMLKGRIRYNIASYALSSLVQLINLVSIPFIFICPEIAIGLYIVSCNLEAVNYIVYFAVNFFLRMKLKKQVLI